MAIGLDVFSESRRSYEDDNDDDDFDEDFAYIPHATSSMDTVPSSNITPHPTPRKSTTLDGSLFLHDDTSTSETGNQTLT